MMISELMRDLGRILSANGDHPVKCRGRSDIEFEDGELVTFDGYALGSGLVVAHETGWRSTFRTVSAPGRRMAEFLCFGSPLCFPRGVKWHRPDATQSVVGTDPRTRWVSPNFVKLVRNIISKMKEDMTVHSVYLALDPNKEDLRLIEEVAAAIEILVDCGVLTQANGRLALAKAI